MEPARRPSSVSPTLLAVLALALAVGAAASLITGAATAPSFHPGPTSSLLASPVDLEVTFAAAAVVLVGMILWIRSDSARLAIPGRLAVTGFAAVLVGILLVALFRAVSGASPGFLSSSPASNSTGGGAPPNSSAPPAPSGNVTAPLGPLVSHLPSWALFAGVATAAMVLGALALPTLWRRARERDEGRVPPRSRATELAEVRGALAGAALSLEQGDEPRTVIVRLYATILERVGPMVGGVEEETPEEIRALHLERLGIRTSAATTITRLFEEARYSSHPMGPEAAARAATAIQQARGDLDRTPASP